MKRALISPRAWLPTLLAGAREPAPSAGFRRPDARTGRARRLSLLAVLALLVGALSLFAPATAEARTTLWSGTLTVGTGGNEAGCGSQSGGACSGRLTTDGVTIEGVAYRITEIVVQSWTSPPKLRLGLTRRVPHATLRDNPHGRTWKKMTLQVGGTSFDVLDAPGFDEISDAASAVQWENPGLSWTAGQQVQARLFYNDQPSVPRNVRAIAVDNQVNLNWDAPSSWGDGTAGGFHIAWKPTGSGVSNWTPVNRVQTRFYEVEASVSSFVLSGTQRLEGRNDRVIDARNNNYDLRIRAFSANPKVPSDWVEVTSTPLTLVPGNKQLTASWTVPGDTYELQYKETDAPDRKSVTGADPALGWVNYAQRLDRSRYVMDIRTKTAVIRGVVLKETSSGPEYEGLKPGTSYDVRLRATTGGTAGSWLPTARATTLGTKPAAETTTEPTRPPSRRVELLKEQTIWTATLTVGGTATYFGCDDTYAPVANCSAALTTNSFTHEGTANTVTRLYIDASDANVELSLEYGTAISEANGRRLTLHVDGKSFPLAGNRATAQASGWTNTGLTWTTGQRVQVRLTAREWTGVEFSGAGFVPSDEWWVHDLLVPEGGSETFGIKLTKQPTANVTVTLWRNTTPGLVHGDVNAATVSPATLTFTPTNYNTVQTVTVTGVADDDSDHEHLWIRAVLSSTDTDYSSPDFHESVFVTVTDSGGAAQLGAWPAVAREAGNGQTRNVPVTVWLSRSVAASVSVSYRTVNGTATAGSDYTAVNGTLTFAAGETRKTVNIPILDDNVEDSGDTFYLVLSNPAGASLEPGYTRAGIQILNDEAHLDGLSAEGAGSGDGPWENLALGAFAPETTDYAVTVPHGTTHVRLTPETGDEDMTIRAGIGTDLTRVRSSEAGPAVALAVGDNVLVVKTTAGTGVHETYTVTVTREASQQPKPELSDFVKQYDANDNGLIDLIEYAQAGQDYGNKVITFEQFTEVKNAWSESRKYADQIAELPNRSPTVQSAFDDITLVGRGDSRQISTSGRFSDPDGHTITMIEAASSAQNVASVAMASDDSSLTVTGGSSGTATITVTAHDGHNGRVSDTFTVTVKAAPTVASAIADIGSLVAGTSQEVTLTSVFSDADNDTLTPSASSSATAVATVSVATDGSKLTVAGVAEGTATITVTAQDSDGNSVSDTFDVTVPAVNKAPTVASAISDATIVNTSGTKRVSLSGVFTDADGDSLTITATTSAAAVATVSVAADYSSLTVTAKSRGTATITVTASDGKGGSVEDSFTVTVKAAPVVASAIADVSELAVDETHKVSLSGVFSDADADSLTVTAGSSKDAVATVSVAADQSGLTLTGKTAGTATITVTAQDSDGNSVSDAFDVTVVKVNSAPTVASAIGDATIVNESGTKRVSLSGVFTDADSDSLTITASSSDEKVATVSVSADYSGLTVTAKARGTATITVTAKDGNGGSVEDSFTVTVKAAPAVASAIADIGSLVAGTSQEVALTSVFSDTDNDTLTLSASSSATAVATVSVATDGSKLTVAGVAEGTATITVTAQDSDGNSVSDTFDVTVPAVNKAPTVASAISDATIVNTSGTKRVSLSGVFTDADGDSLTITATTSAAAVATVSVAADYSSLTVTAKSRGTATVTVTAVDGKGGSVEDSFTVTVKSAPVVASAIADISELATGASQQISLSSVFSDADGDALTLSAVSSNDAVVTVLAQIDPSTGSATAITVTGVDEGTATVTVTARDTDGNSVSDTFDVTVPAVEEQQQAAELPGPVVSLAVTASAEDSVTVSWSAPETGGAPQGYIVHIKRKGGGYQDTRRPGADRTTVSFSSLDSGRTYDVWVRAQNGTGKGERVSASITLPESEDTLPTVLPGPVAGLELTADGNTLTVSWSAPETGGAPEGYIVHVSPDDGGKGKTKTPKAMKTQVTFKNMEAGRTYGVWVRAQNEAGKGERVHASITLPEQEDAHTGQ